MKKLKIILLSTFMIVSVSILSFTIYTYNNCLKFNNSEIVIFENNPKQNSKQNNYWSGNANLNNENFCNIINYNNFFADTPTITNDISNNEAITIRFINESGEIVSSEKTINPGETVKLDKIDPFKGMLTIQGVSEKSSSYYFTLN